MTDSLFDEVQKIVADLEPTDEGRARAVAHWWHVVRPVLNPPKTAPPPETPEQRLAWLEEHVWDGVVLIGRELARKSGMNPPPYRAEEFAP